MGARPWTEAWSTDEGPQAWKNLTALLPIAISCQQLLIRVGLGESLPSPHYNVDGFDLTQVSCRQPQPLQVHACGRSDMSRKPWFSDFLTIPDSCSSPLLCPSLQGFLGLARKGCDADILFQAEH